MSLIVCRLIGSNTATGPTVDVRQRLARNLREQRAKRGLSQEQFAFEAGIRRTYISDLERGSRNPTIVVVDRILV